MVNHDITFQKKRNKINNATKIDAFPHRKRYGLFLSSLLLGLSATMNTNAMDRAMSTKSGANVQVFSMPTKGEMNAKDFLVPTRVNANTVKGQTEKPVLTVFISTRLPKPSLLAWSEEAKRYGATLVLRGFVNNSLQETLRALTLDDKTVLTVSIDPVAFEKHHVAAVPLVLFTHQGKEDRMAGNSGLQAALESIANQGDLHEEASMLLTREKAQARLTQSEAKTKPSSTPTKKALQ